MSSEFCVVWSSTWFLQQHCFHGLWYVEPQVEADFMHVNLDAAEQNELHSLTQEANEPTADIILKLEAQDSKWDSDDQQKVRYRD